MDSWYDGLNESENSLFLVWIVTKESQAPAASTSISQSSPRRRDQWCAPSDGLTLARWPGGQGGGGRGSDSRVTSPAFLYPTSRQPAEAFENGSLHWADTLGSIGRKPLEVSHLDETFVLLWFSLRKKYRIRIRSKHFLIWAKKFLAWPCSMFYVDYRLLY